MKKKTIIRLSVVGIIALAIGGAYAADMHRMNTGKPVIFSSWGYDYAPPEEQNGFSLGVDETENYSKQQSFVGTVIEETTSYMIVAPSEDETERKNADRIKVSYGKDHRDFLYGTGRKVVVYYEGEIKDTAPVVIQSDSISPDGFREFEITVTPSETKLKKLVIRERQPHDSDPGWHRQYNLYYYGVEEVFATVDGQHLPLEDAIEQGKVSMAGILSKASRDAESGVAEILSYRDGGSQIYTYPDHTIVKYHTLEGNRDMYIGSSDMDISVAGEKEA